MKIENLENFENDFHWFSIKNFRKVLKFSEMFCSRKKVRTFASIKICWIGLLKKSGQPICFWSKNFKTSADAIREEVFRIFLSGIAVAHIYIFPIPIPWGGPRLEPNSNPLCVCQSNVIENPRRLMREDTFLSVFVRSILACTNHVTAIIFTGHLSDLSAAGSHLETLCWLPRSSIKVALWT